VFSGKSVPDTKLYVVALIVLLNPLVVMDVSVEPVPLKCSSTHVSWKLNFQPTLGGYSKYPFLLAKITVTYNSVGK
jgi:hypothetical protein